MDANIYLTTMLDSDCQSLEEVAAVGLAGIVSGEQMDDIRFQFDPQKALAAIVHILSRRGSVEKVKLMKLLYLADKRHFIKTGVPITGDRLVAMRLGPVPSSTLNMVNGLYPIDGGSVYDTLNVVNNDVFLRTPPGEGESALSASERETIDAVLNDHGDTYRWRLVEETHKLPEYIEHYVKDTSTPIPFETIAKHSGNPDRWQFNRPVITTAMAAAIRCPFKANADADL